MIMNELVDVCCRILIGWRVTFLLVSLICFFLNLQVEEHGNR